MKVATFAKFGLRGGHLAALTFDIGLQVLFLASLRIGDDRCHVSVFGSDLSFSDISHQTYQSRSLILIGKTASSNLLLGLAASANRVGG